MIRLGKRQTLAKENPKSSPMMRAMDCIKNIGAFTGKQSGIAKVGALDNSHLNT